MATYGFQPLEEIFFNGMLSAVGNPMWLGFLVVGFFLGFVIFQGTRLDVKIFAMTAALILGGIYSPFIPLFGFLGLGIILYWGIMRGTQK